MRRSAASILCLLLVACGEVAPADEGATSADSGGGSDSGSDIDVVLLTGAADSGHVLRLHPEVGDVQTITMTQTIEMEVDDGVQTASTDTVTRTTMSLVVDEVDADGMITFTTTVDDAEVVDTGNLPPAGVDQVEATIEAMIGMTAVMRMDDRGRPLDSEMDLPDDFDPTMREMMEQLGDQFQNMGAPWPEEPVEVGSVWTVDWPIELLGLDLGMTMTYELVSLDGDDYVLDVSFEDNPDLELGRADVPGGDDVELTDYDQRGEGRQSGSLRALLPVDGTSEATSHVVMVVEGPEGDDVDIVQDMTMTIELDS